MERPSNFNERAFCLWFQNPAASATLHSTHSASESFNCAHNGHMIRLCLGCLVRIIARRTLREFIESLRGSKDQKAVKSALDAWFHEAQLADWRGPADLIRNYASASIVGDRVVFNIKGNSYRLVVAVDYRRQLVFIKWIGSHRAYDKIDVKKVKYGD